MARPAPEGTIKAVYLSVAELPRHTLAGQPPFFEHRSTPLPAYVIEDALEVGAIGTQPAAQCGGANVERIGDFFRNAGVGGAWAPSECLAPRAASANKPPGPEPISISTSAAK